MEEQLKEQLAIAMKTLEWINNFSNDKTIKQITTKALEDIKNVG